MHKDVWSHSKTSLKHKNCKHTWVHEIALEDLKMLIQGANKYSDGVTKYNKTSFYMLITKLCTVLQFMHR